jgi:hypothetical protein
MCLGAVDVLEPEISADERQRLERSADVLRKLPALPEMGRDVVIEYRRRR